MFKKYVLIICTAFLFMMQCSGLHAMDSSVKYFQNNDVGTDARLLRSAIIKSSCDYVEYLIEFYKKNRRNDYLIAILYDTKTSIGNKTMIEDLFCYRPKNNGSHKEIFFILVNAFKEALLSAGLFEDAVKREMLLWMIFSKEGSTPPYFLNCDRCQCIELIPTFVEHLISLGGQSAITKILDTSLNGRGYTVRHLILHSLSRENSGRLLECLVGS